MYVNLSHSQNNKSCARDLNIIFLTSAPVQILKRRNKCNLAGFLAILWSIFVIHINIIKMSGQISNSSKGFNTNAHAVDSLICKSLFTWSILSCLQSRLQLRPIRLDWSYRHLANEGPNNLHLFRDHLPP